MGIDELDQLGCAGPCDGDDPSAVVLEERLDDGEADTSGWRSGRSMSIRIQKPRCACDEDDWVRHRSVFPCPSAPQNCNRGPLQLVLLPL